MNLTDLELMEGVREGNLPSLEALVGRHGKTLQAFFFFLTWDRVRSEDAVQEVYRVFWNTRNSRKPVGIPRKILLQTALDLRRTHAPGPAGGPEDVPIDYSHPFWEGYLRGLGYEEESRGEWDEKVRKELASVPDEEKLPLVLVRFAGVDPDECASLLGVPLPVARDRILSALDRLAAPLASGAGDSVPPCAEPPARFPLPGETPEPAAHFASCTSCGRRLEAHRDVWEILGNQEPPALRERLWPELKKALQSGLKLRTVHPTGRLPRPLPEEELLVRRTSKFWLRVTIVASVVIALVALYSLVVPSGGSRPDGPGPAGPAPEGNARPAAPERRPPVPAPPAFSLEAGSPDEPGSSVVLRALGSGTVDFFVYRVRDEARFLSAAGDFSRPALHDGPLAAELAAARGSDPSSLFALAGSFETRLVLSTAATVGRQTIPLELPGPGLYVVEAQRGDFVAHALKVSGRLRLQCRRTPSRAAAAVSDATGRPVTGAVVRVFARALSFAPRRAGSDCLFFEGLPDGAPLAVLAVKDGDVALALCPPLPRAPAPVPWILPDRPCAAPGSHVEIVGFVPPRSGRLAVRLRAEGAAPLEVPLVRSPSGFFTARLPTPRAVSDQALDLELLDNGTRIAAAPFALRRGAGARFIARAAEDVIVAGTAATFLVEAWPPDPARAFGPCAFRLRLHPSDGEPSVLLEGAVALDARGRAEVKTQALLRPGRLVLEAGAAPDVRVPLAQVVVKASRFEAAFEMPAPFAEAGVPFSVLLALRDVLGRPVAEAEVCSFVSGAALAEHAGARGRTDAAGLVAVELLFSGPGRAELSCSVFTPDGSELRVARAFPVSDGTAVGGGRPELMARREGAKIRVLARGFGPAPLVTALGSSGALRRVALSGELGWIEDPGRLRIYAQGAGPLGPREAALDVEALRAPAGLTVRSRSSWEDSGEGAADSVIAWGSGTDPLEDVVLVGSPVPIPSSALPAIADEPLSLGASSAGTTSSGEPHVGPARFVAAAGERAGGDRERAVLLERLRDAGVSEREIARFQAMEAPAALAEMRGRAERNSPLPRLAASPSPNAPETDAAAPPAPLPAVSWVRAARDGASGNKEWSAPGLPLGSWAGRRTITVLGASGGAIRARTEQVVDLVRPTGLRVSVPPGLRPGDEIEARLELSNGESAPLVGTLTLALADSSSRSAIEVQPGETRTLGLRVTVPEHEGELNAGFSDDAGLDLGTTQTLPLLQERGDWTWAAGGVLQNGDGYAAFSPPAGSGTSARAFAVFLARDAADLAHQGWVALRLDHPSDALAHAGVLLAFAAGTTSGQAEPPAALRLLRQTAQESAEELLRCRRVDGRFARWAGGPPDPLATAVATHALAACRGRIPLPEAEAFWAGLSQVVTALSLDPLLGEDERAYLLLAGAALGDVEGLETRIARAFSESHRSRLSPQALACLSLALARVRERDARRRIAQELGLLVRFHGREVRFMRLEGPGRSLGDPVVAAGLVLAALEPGSDGDPLAPGLADFLARERHGIGWGGPFRTAMAVLGLSSRAPSGGEPVPFTVELNAAREASASPREGAFLGEADLWPEGNFLAFGTTTERPQYWALLAQGAKPPSARTDVTVLRGIVPLVEMGGQWDVKPGGGNVRLDSPAMATVYFDLPAPRSEVQVTVPLPAGTVPLSLPLRKEALPAPGSLIAREGCVVAFFPRLPRGPATIRIAVLPLWRGRFGAPPVEVRSLLEEERAVSTSETLVVD